MRIPVRKKLRMMMMMQGKKNQKVTMSLNSDCDNEKIKTVTLKNIVKTELFNTNIRLNKLLDIQYMSLCNVLIKNNMKNKCHNVISVRTDQINMKNNALYHFGNDAI